MGKKKFLITILLLLISFLTISTPVSARDWDDLHEEDEKVFGSEKELKYNPDMFFLQREVWDNHYSFMFFWLFKYTDYPKYSSLRILPFYYGLDSKTDNRTLSFLPLALTYWETDGDEKYRINPLFISGSSSNSGWVDNYSVSLIHGYFYTKSSKMDRPERTWWAPIIPLIFRSTDSYGGHMNIGWLLDYSWSRDKSGEETLQRFWFMPLIFHEPGDNGYSHMLPPVFLYNRHSNGEYWISLLPLFKRSKDINYTYSSSGKYGYEYEDSFKSLIFCYNSVYDDKWTGEKKISEFWLPIVPLIYSYSEKGVESHRNIFWLLDWHNDKDGNTDRFWFAPFYFGGDSYRHILPPVYMSFNYSENDNYSHLFPLYLSSRSETSVYDPESRKNIPLRERLLLTPLSGYTSTKEFEGNGKLDTSSYWFPIIPLYYHSEESKGTHTNLLWILDWKRDSEGNMKRFFFIPFVFHESGEGGYRFYLPFFFRPSGWSETDGVTYSPVYYHRWTPDEDTRWTWLIHYKSINRKTSDYLNAWIPLYYNHEDPAEGDTTWIAPVYYHHDSLKHDGYFARVFAPLYWNFETETRDTTLFLPLYFDTEDKNGKNSFHVNIAGISRSVTSGINPVIDAGLGFNRRGLYVDIDVSWLYDMLSLATRMTIPMKAGESKTAGETITGTDTGKVTLTKKSGVNRDESISFWGWHFFYGLAAYEHADTKKHFRLLPLSWLTWDEKSDDKLKVILNYISYKEGETEYLVFIPLYGYQRIGESFTTGYLLNGFWHEYDHEKQLNEYTILWPLINWYSSPEKDGWRVLPVAWHKNSIDKGNLYSATYTPLSFSRSLKNIDDGSTLYRMNFSPLHFYRFEKEKSGSSKLWFSSIPVVFYWNTENVSRIVMEPETSGSISSGAKKGKKEVKKVYSDYRTSDTLRWIFPLYLVSESVTKDSGKNISTTDYSLYGLPLLYYNSVTEKSSDPAVPDRKSGTLFILGYYNEFSSDNNSSSILFGLYESEKYPSTGDYSYGLLWGLFNLSQMEGRYENYFRPFYYYGNEHGKTEHSALMGIYRKKYDTNNGDAGFSLAYGLFSTSLHHYTADPDKKSIPLETRETWLIPAFYYSNTESSTEDKPWKDNLSLSLFHYRHFADRGYGEEYTFWAPIIPLYYYSEDNESRHTNLLWLIDYKTPKDDKFTRFWIHPVIYSKTGDDGYFNIAPFYFSGWNDEYRDYKYFICGLYLHNMPGYSRQNFLYLFDHINYDSGKYHEYSLLFNTLEYDIAPEVRNMRAMWGLLLDAEWNRGGYDIEGLLWLAAIESSGDYFHTRAIPLWYYESTENTHTLVIPPALTWDSKDSDDSRFQLWALGALWYRDYEPGEKSDLQAALLGIPYYKIQRAERGYESWGSVWGLLWQYETETETGFSKFSLLKFIYKRVEMDGEVQHRVLGITF